MEAGESRVEVRVVGEAKRRLRVVGNGRIRVAELRGRLGCYEVRSQPGLKPCGPGGAFAQVEARGYTEVLPRAAGVA